MKMYILTIIFTAMSFSAHAAAPAPLDRDNALEAECASLPADAIAAKKTQCTSYYEGLVVMAENRIDECGTDKQCVQTATAQKNRISERSVQMSRRAAAQGVASAESAGKCSELIEQAKKEVPFKGNLNAEGTEALFNCVKLSKGYFRELYKNGSKNSPSADWEKFITYSDQCIEVAAKNCGKNSPPTEESFKASLANCAKENEIRDQALKCDAAAFLISLDKDFDNSEDNKADTFKDQASGIVCSSKGIETLDYAACVKFVQNFNLMEAAQGAIQKGQELYYADKTMDAQSEAAKSDNSATAALQALKSSVKSQKEIMEQRAALDSGKLAALASMYMDIPDLDVLTQKCKRYSPPPSIVSGNSATVCTQALNIQPGFGFLLNQMAKEKMKAKLVKVGIDVGSDAVMAGLMAKREGDLNNAIANVESFKPIDPVAPQADNMQTTFCQMNPGDPKCLTGGLDRTLDMMNDNVITFGEGGTGTSYANTNPFKDTGTTNSNAISPTNRNSVTGVGSAIAAAQQNGGLANPIAAGSITKGNGPTGGGGGGGGGGGSSGGGGGGGVPAAQNPGGVSAAIQGKTPSYGGGTGFSLVGGGSGLRGKKASAKEENPFGKLFNKNGNANGALNFREIASQKVGTKGDNLFDMISKRYSTVSSDKRLIEYELAK